MAFDTDNNFLVTGASGDGVIATDYSISEGSHFQVNKLAYGSSGEFIRVTDTVGLPVSVKNSSIPVTIASMPTTSVTGTVSITGTVGVSATNFGIRALTAGDPTAGTATGADFVRIVGYSGGWAVGVTASNFGIRALTAGSLTSGTAHTGADFVRVVGASGAYPIAVTGTSFDIRGLSGTRDFVTVYGTASVAYNGATPFSKVSADGFQTRVLRATIGANPITAAGSLDTNITHIEDSVRVVGLSGAYPVNTLPGGLTNIADSTTRVPFKVSTTGSLYVELAAGTIGVTATISGSSLTLAGLSLTSATAAAQVMQVHGYTGTGMIPIAVTGASFDIRGLTSTRDSVFAVIRTLTFDGTTGDTVGITGSVASDLRTLAGAVSGSPAKIQVTESNSSNINSSVGNVKSSVDSLKQSFDNTVGTLSVGGSAQRVIVSEVAQPTGITSGKVNVALTATQMGTLALQSGIHIKADLVNTGTVFVGTNNTALSGYALFNGDQVFIETDNTNKIWLSASVAGLSAYYIGT
jgi:hypothetical protein